MAQRKRQLSYTVEFNLESSAGTEKWGKQARYHATLRDWPQTCARMSRERRSARGEPCRSCQEKAIIVAALLSRLEIVLHTGGTRGSHTPWGDITRQFSCDTVQLPPPYKFWHFSVQEGGHSDGILWYMYKALDLYQSETWNKWHTHISTAVAS